MLPRALVPLLVRSAPGNTVVIVGEDAHHWARVLRLNVGERVCLFNGEGLEAQAEIQAIEVRREVRVVVQLLDALRPGVGPDASGTIWLQGYPKADKLERVVRQATELGVRAVWPIITKRVVVRAIAEDLSRTERFRAIAQSAAAQCGRADVPEVRDPVELGVALAALPGAVKLRLVPWESARESLRAAIARVELGQCAVLVGPEGGLDEDEVKLAGRHGFSPVSLGPRIWRTETVAPALLAILSFARGDLTTDR